MTNCLGQKALGQNVSSPKRPGVERGAAGSYPVCRQVFFRVTVVREKHVENGIFPGQGRAKVFCVYLGKFKKDWKINGYSNSLHKIYLFCLRGLDLFSGKIIHVQTVYLPSHLELLLTRRTS